MRRSHGLILLAVLIALALWWLLGGDEGDAPIEVAGGASAAQPAEAITEGQTENPEALKREDALQPERPEAGAISGPTFSVLVLHRDEDTPVPDAEVLIYDPEIRYPPEAPSRESSRVTNETIVEWCSRHYRSDASGRTKLPLRDDPGFMIAARAGDLWGFRFIAHAEAAAGEVKIHVEKDIQVRVLVVDEAKRPVPGVLVAYRPLQSGRGNNVADTVTGADGIAHLRHLQEEYRRHSDRADEHIVAIELPLDPSAQAAFDPLAPPADPIVLVMPATGVVEVELLDILGRPVDGLHVMLQRKLREVDRQESEPARGLHTQSWLGLTWSRAVNGVARFEKVGLDLTLEFGADFERTGAAEAGSGPGPSRPGEIVRFVLQQTVAAPILTGRLVDGDGNPLPDQDLSADIYAEGGEDRLARLRFTTGADGRFRGPVSLDLEDASPKVLVASAEQPGRVLLLAANVAAPLSPGENDLGDVILGGPLLVSGTVLTPDGAPESMAYGTIRPAGRGRQGRGPFDSISWKAGADGRFEVRGKVPPNRYQTRAAKTGQEDWRSDSVVFDPGTKGLELRFLSLPGVRGRILVDVQSDLKDIQLGLMKSQRDGVGASPEDNGRFIILAGEPGVYDLVIRHAFARNILLVRGGIQLSQKGCIEIGDMDLRGLPRTHLNILDPEGRQVPDARFGLEGNDEFPVMFLHQAPVPLTILHSNEQRSAIVEVEGYARTEVKLNGGEQVLRLAEGYQIAVALENLPPAPAGLEWGVFLYIKPVEGKLGRSNLEQAIQPGYDTAELVSTVDGTWMAGLCYRKPPSIEWLYIQKAFGDPAPIIEVKPVIGRQEFRVYVDAGVVASAMAGR
jgi:hypothetical protein